MIGFVSALIDRSSDKYASGKHLLFDRNPANTQTSKQSKSSISIQTLHMVCSHLGTVQPLGLGQRQRLADGLDGRRDQEVPGELDGVPRARVRGAEGEDARARRQQDGADVMHRGGVGMEASEFMSFRALTDNQVGRDGGK